MQFDAGVGIWGVSINPKWCKVGWYAAMIRAGWVKIRTLHAYISMIDYKPSRGYAATPYTYYEGVAPQP